MTVVYGVGEIDKAVEALMPLLQKTRIITFTGTLGAGKTTLVRALLKKCGVTELITSPTFSYVNKYVGAHNHLFYHFDLYRLASLDEFIAHGFEEYLHNEQAWSFVEWPEIIKPITSSAYHVRLDYYGDEQRVMIVTQGEGK